VDVRAEDELLLGYPLELGGELLVAGVVHDQLVLVERGRVGPRGPDREAVAGRDLANGPAKLAELIRGLDDVRARPGGDLEDGLHQLRLHLSGQVLGEIAEDHLDRLR
jgi:hypothetical protein